MDDFTVADVYEHAAKIGQDIERLIRDYGESSVEDLMPKIVFTLEQLEGLAERRHKDTSAIDVLNAEKERLLIECKREALIRRQTEEKVEYLENMMNDDTKSMQHTINVLRKENEFLKSEVEELDEEVTTQRDQARPSNVDLIVKMRMAIDSQKDEIRELNQENERHKSEIDALNEQTNRLTDMNEKLRIYNSKLQDRLAETIEHKVQAEATLASVKIVKEDEDKENVKIAKETKVRSAGGRGSLRENQNVAQATVKKDGDVATSIEEDMKEELVNTKGPTPPELGPTAEPVKNEAEDSDGFVLVPHNDSEANNKKKKTFIDRRKTVKSVKKEEVVSEEKNTPKNEAESPKKEDENEKPIKKDPNRPRYTLAEMQQVLEERNRFKERVSVLEDVLAAYVPGPVRSSTLDKNDEGYKKRRETGAKKGKETPKKEPKVRGM
eukprot:gene15367-6599_t